MSAPIGQMRYRVTLQRRERSADEGGTAAVAWSDVATMFAQVRGVGGRQIVDGDAIAGRVTHEVTIRFLDGVEPTMRFVEGARQLLIHAVLDKDGRRRWLTCQCEERRP